jgi:hypothetical protein
MEDIYKMNALMENQIKPNLMEAGYDPCLFNLVNLVFETTKYDAFKYLPGNRGICENKVKTIKKSIQQYGYIGEAIIVTNKFEIIDGQHRFNALKELNMPIIYSIVTLNQVKYKAAQNMNSAQSGWRFNDHINSFASLGNLNYVNLKNIMMNEKYKSIPDGTKLAVVTKYYYNSSNGLTAKVIKNGLLFFPEQRLEYVKATLDSLLPIVEIIKNKKMSGKKDLFLNAIIFLSNIHNSKNKFDLTNFINNFMQTNSPADDLSSFNNCLKYIVKVHNKSCECRFKLKPVLSILEDKKASDKKWVKNQMLLQQNQKEG